MGNILSNTDISENYDRKIQIEKLTPIGREIIENYRPVRVDPKTVILVKPENYKFSENEKLSKKGKQVKKNRKENFPKRKLYVETGKQKASKKEC